MRKIDNSKNLQRTLVYLTSDTFLIIPKENPKSMITYASPTSNMYSGYEKGECKDSIEN